MTAVGRTKPTGPFASTPSPIAAYMASTVGQCCGK